MDKSMITMLLRLLVAVNLTSTCHVLAFSTPKPSSMLVVPTIQRNGVGYRSGVTAIAMSRQDDFSRRNNRVDQSSQTDWRYAANINYDKYTPEEFYDEGSPPPPLPLPPPQQVPPPLPPLPQGSSLQPPPGTSSFGERPFQRQNDNYWSSQSYSSPNFSRRDSWNNNQQRAYRESKFQRNPEWPQNTNRRSTRIGGGGELVRRVDNNPRYEGGYEGRMPLTPQEKFYDDSQTRYGQLPWGDNTQYTEDFRSAGRSTNSRSPSALGYYSQQRQGEQGQRLGGYGQEIGFKTRQQYSYDNDPKQLQQRQQRAQQQLQQRGYPQLSSRPIRTGANIGEKYTKDFRKGSKSGGYNYRNEFDQVGTRGSMGTRSMRESDESRQSYRPRRQQFEARDDDTEYERMMQNRRIQSRQSQRSYGTDIRDYDDDGRLESIDYDRQPPREEFDKYGTGYRGQEFEKDDVYEVFDRLESLDEPRRRRPTSGITTASKKWGEEQRNQVGIGGKSMGGKRKETKFAEPNIGDFGYKASRGDKSPSSQRGVSGEGQQLNYFDIYPKPSPIDRGQHELQQNQGRAMSSPRRSRPQERVMDYEQSKSFGSRGRDMDDYDELRPPTIQSKSNRSGRRGMDYDELGPPTLKSSSRGRGIDYDELRPPPIESKSFGSRGQDMQYDELGPPTMQRGQDQYQTDSFGRNPKYSEPRSPPVPPLENSSFGSMSGRQQTQRYGASNSFERQQQQKESSRRQTQSFGSRPPYQAERSQSDAIMEDPSYNESTLEGDDFGNRRGQQWQEPQRYGATSSFERQQQQKESTRVMQSQSTFGSQPQYKPGRSQSDVLMDDQPNYGSDRQYQPRPTIDIGTAKREEPNPVKRFFDKLLKPNKK